MKPEIGFMNQLTTKNILDDLNFAVENDFDWFEIGLDWKQNLNLNSETVKQIKKISEENKIRLIVHTAWYLPTSTIIPEIRKGVMLNVKKAILLAKKVGSDRITIHPGYREMPAPAMKLCYESLTNNLREIVKIGKQYDVNVCLENWDNSEHLLCNNFENFLSVLNSVKGIKATLDIGHANTTEKSVLEYFESTKDFIMDMHVHDNNGKRDEHKCLGEGNIDFKKLFSECKKYGYFGPFVLEIFPYENILKGKKILSDFWQKA